MRLRNLLILGGLIALSAYAKRRMAARRAPAGRVGDSWTRPVRQVAANHRAAPVPHRDAVRYGSAGRELTPVDRSDWDKVDVASYESFPASDPPGY